MPRYLSLFPYTTLFRSRPQRHEQPYEQDSFFSCQRHRPYRRRAGGARATARAGTADGCCRGTAGPQRAASSHLRDGRRAGARRSEEHTSELQSPCHLVCPATSHSFPTRRSSDLGPNAMSSHMSRTASFLVSAIVLTAGVPAAHAQPPAPAPPTVAAAARQDRNELRRHIYVMEGALARADRKSTRLNSSHLVTSYAPLPLTLSLHDALPISAPTP